MNTGIQRSSSTPFGAMTTTSPPGKKSIGQATWKKNMPKIAAAHNIPYVATACPSYPFDLFAKVKKARMVDGPSYLHILSVCPTGWRIPSDQAIRYGRLAVESGMFPLYEVESGKYRLTYNPEPLSHVVDYFNGQGRYRHLTVRTISQIQERVNQDWKKLKYQCGLK
jgi:pyruvate ferredoxin oxidoreductase beta subunit